GVFLKHDGWFWGALNFRHGRLTSLNQSLAAFFCRGVHSFFGPYFSHPEKSPGLLGPKLLPKITNWLKAFIK
ncbi:MAG: hypothetical protein LBE80_03720, partial [Deltaproteobacteria bacterium]|nr:hypothetical protein [Deltaproteobacteria bacterium]